MKKIQRREASALPPPHDWWTAPVVWSSAVEGATAALNSNLEEALNSVMPRASAEVHPDGLLTPTSSSGPSRMGLRRALRRLARPASRSYAFLILSPKQWRKLNEHLHNEHPEWMASSKLPEGECVGALAPANQTAAFERMLHWRMMALAGMAGGGMHLHADTPPLSNVHLQVRGVKRWALCPPRHDATRFYCAGAANAFATRSAASACPTFSNDSCYEAVLGPGESLFYPGRWWHQTVASESAASLSRSLITVGDAAHFAPAMQQMCDDARLLNSHLDVCEALAPCLRRLSRILDASER
jgi:hypothetical protein